MKKVFKYGTGEEIPEGAVYLSTQVDTASWDSGESSTPVRVTRNDLVWHYFLVEVKDA